MSDPPEPDRKPRLGRRILAGTGVALAVLVVTALVTAIFIRLPYVVTSPGPVTVLDGQVLRIEGAPTYDHNGQFLFLTVSQTNRRPNVYRLLRGWLDDSMTVQPEDEVFGDEPRADERTLNELLMEQSQIAAKTAALRVLGYDVEVASSGAIVAGIEADGAAHSKLRLSDVITAVDGVPTTTAPTVGDAIRARRPGDELRISVERRGADQRVAREDVVLTADERDGEAFLGILLETYLEQPDFPVEITLDTRQVRGPSAGLAFALAIINDLSPGDVTGGQGIAVTGTVDVDGNVGPVGGIEQKTVGARRAGAQLLLVPEAEVDEARRHAGSLPVAGIATVDDAIGALVDAGGAAPETAPASLAA